MNKWLKAIEQALEQQTAINTICFGAMFQKTTSVITCKTAQSLVEAATESQGTAPDFRWPIHRAAEKEKKLDAQNEAHPAHGHHSRHLHPPKPPDQDWPMGVARTGEERETDSSSASLSFLTQERGPARMEACPPLTP